MLIPEAVHLVLQAAAHGVQGAIYILEMGEQIKLLDLAHNLIRLSGFLPEKEISIKFVGLRPGEKLEEELIGKDEAAEPSSIDKILKIKSSAPVDMTFLTQKLKELEEASVLGNPRLAIKQLQELVPDFQQPKRIPPSGHMESVESLGNTKSVESAEVSNVGKRILLVDDDCDARSTIRALLESQGYVCVEVDHGAMALEWLQNSRVDLIITDNKMPIMKGLDFLERLKKINGSKVPRVMVLSGHLDKQDKERAFKAGACAVFEKPCNSSELLPTIEKILTHP